MAEYTVQEAVWPDMANARWDADSNTLTIGYATASREMTHQEIIEAQREELAECKQKIASLKSANELLFLASVVAVFLLALSLV